jgi:RNA ligase
MKHIAHTILFDELFAGLQAAEEAKLVNENSDGEIYQYCYTENCVYSRAWDKITISARGIILNPATKKIIATPFPKFFNYGENDCAIPNTGFEIFEKLDGSLIIIFFYNGEWRCATKGSLNSEQAKWAKNYLKNIDTSLLNKRVTYLAEAIYSENKIVIRYDDDGLVLLGAYNNDGTEISSDEVREIAILSGFTLPRIYYYKNINEILDIAKTLPVTEEGFVLRFNNGLRLKIKGDEYKRIHALISKLSPLSVWQILFDNMDLITIKKELPEEFWEDFDNIVNCLQENINIKITEIKNTVDPLSNLSDKEVGLKLESFNPNIKPFVFAYRKTNGNFSDSKLRKLLFNSIRPYKNILKGYIPSFGIKNILRES